MLLSAAVRAREATRAGRVVPVADPPILGTCGEGEMDIIGGGSTCAQASLSIPNIAYTGYRRVPPASNSSILGITQCHQYRVLELLSYASMLSIRQYVEYQYIKNCVCISTV